MSKMLCLVLLCLVLLCLMLLCLELLLLCLVVVLGVERFGCLLMLVSFS